MLKNKDAGTDLGHPPPITGHQQDIKALTNTFWAQSSQLWACLTLRYSSSDLISLQLKMLWDTVSKGFKKSKYRTRRTDYSFALSMPVNVFQKNILHSSDWDEIGQPTVLHFPLLIFLNDGCNVKAFSQATHSRYLQCLLLGLAYDGLCSLISLYLRNASTSLLLPVISIFCMLLFVF